MNAPKDYKVLMVQDNIGAQENLSLLLKSRGILSENVKIIYHTSQLSEEIASVIQGSYDLVLMDRDIGGGMTDELLENLLLQGCQTPIVSVSTLENQAQIYDIPYLDSLVDLDAAKELFDLLQDGTLLTNWKNTIEKRKDKVRAVRDKRVLEQIVHHEREGIVFGNSEGNLLYYSPSHQCDISINKKHIAILFTDGCLSDPFPLGNVVCDNSSYQGDDFGDQFPTTITIKDGVLRFPSASIFSRQRLMDFLLLHSDKDPSYYQSTHGFVSIDLQKLHEYLQEKEK